MKDTLTARWPLSQTRYEFQNVESVFVGDLGGGIDVRGGRQVVCRR